MANPRWIGNAANVKQIATLAISGTWQAADTIVCTIDNVDYTITVGSSTTATQVATLVYQAFVGTTLTDTTASTTIPVADGGAQLLGSFAEIVAANPSAGNVTFTARTAGKPFTMTVARTTGATGAISYSGTATANAGRAEADNVDNYDTNAVPVDNDAVYFDEGSNPCLYDLNLACQPLTLNKAKKYTGLVGLAEINRDNTAAGKEYREYRTPRYLTTDDNSVTITGNLEYGPGQGSGRFKWDAGAGQAVVNVFGKGSRAETGVPCILWKGSHASNVVNNLAGDLGIAFFGAETAVVATLRHGDGPTSTAETVVGAGTTLTTVVCNGGKLETNSALTTGTQNGGEWRHKLGTITALTVNGGTFIPMGGATITTLTLNDGATFDASKGTAAFAITNTVQLFKGSKFLDPAGRTGNPVLKLNGCSLEDVTIVLAPGKTLTPS